MPALVIQNPHDGPTRSEESQERNDPTTFHILLGHLHFLYQ